MKTLKTLINQDSKYLTQLDEMKRQLLNPSQIKFTGKILGSPWNRIPAVSKVEVSTKEYNTLLEGIGILHKLPPKITFERNSNHKLNRYIGHQIIRMRKARENQNSRLFWVIAMACLKSSVSFRLSAINHIKPNWWFGISADRIHQINRRVNVIFSRQTKLINFRRVYIPKKDNKWRPLGVPSDEWRIVLHMINNMLVLWFSPEMLPCQHAYIPGRGTITAWRDIVKNVIKSENIYETDLKGFFDNISVFKINNILRQGNVPTDLRVWIHNMFRSIPKFPKDIKLSEEKFTRMESKETVDIDLWTIYEFLGREDGPMVLSSNLNEKTRNLVIQACEEKGLLPEYYLGLSNSYARTPGGVPQGSPLSPFLSILAIRDYLSQAPCVNYADDQIFYGNKAFTIKDIPEQGIVHNKEKSGWIKKDGVWLKELKFLGLIYNPWEGRLRSETRAGRAERIEDSLIELWEEIKYDKDENYLESMVTKNFFGFLQASLYNGSWNPQTSPLKERVVNDRSFLGRYISSRTFSSAALQVLGKTLKVRTAKAVSGKIKAVDSIHKPETSSNETIQWLKRAASRGVSQLLSKWH
jgi:hypothetical protein